MLLTCLCGRTSRVTKVGDRTAFHLGPINVCPETVCNAVECGQPQSCTRRKLSEWALESMCVCVCVCVYMLGVLRAFWTVQQCMTGRPSARYQTAFDNNLTSKHEQ